MGKLFAMFSFSRLADCNGVVHVRLPHIERKAVVFEVSEKRHRRIFAVDPPEPRLGEAADSVAQR